jgi:hypothetical protein
MGLILFRFFTSYLMLIVLYFSNIKTVESLSLLKSESFSNQIISRNINFSRSNGSKLFSTSTANQPAPPTEEKARLSLTISGKSLPSALFRSELKKEAVFFRGCAVSFALNSKSSPPVADIEAEGKTQQLVRFLTWCNYLASDIATRKPNFQGPAVIISSNNC